VSKLAVFNFISIDGYFAGPNGEIEWFKDIPRAPDYEAYARAGAGSGNTLVFGRTTYELMKNYWPTPMAEAGDPDMTQVMRNSPKLVFSRTLKDAGEGPNWKNVTVFPGIDAAELEKRKKREDLMILGSGTIVRQLTDLKLIDEYALMVVPAVLGKGKSMFQDAQRADFRLLNSQAFKNGLTVLHYAAAGSAT
jgi:dihydrofolate reductase